MIQRHRNQRGMLLCAIACLFSGAAAIEVEQAGAKPRIEVHERNLRLSARIEASNGYEGWIATEGHKRVILTLRKGETTIEAQTSGRVTRHGIKARFGDLGRISVRFRGRPLSLLPRDDEDGKPNCRGRKSVFEGGVFSGTIRFRGENGFTEVNSKRAGGFVERNYRRICRPDQKDGSLGALFERLFNGLPLTALRAGARVGGANIIFEAAEIDLRPLFGAWIGVGYVFSAQMTERSEGVQLTRSVSAEGDAGSFLFPRKKKKPRTATVTPPKPLTGTAKYFKQASLPSSWVGSLAARLPGAGLVAMTGPRFKADLCNLTFGALLEGRCLPKTGKVRLESLSKLSQGLPQGSGSQSQALWDVRLSWSR